MRRTFFIIFCLIVFISPAVYAQFGGSPFGQDKFGDGKFGGGSFGVGQEQAEPVTADVHYDGVIVQYDGSDVQYTN